MIIPGKNEIKESIQEYFDDKGQCKLTMSKLRIKVLKLCEYSKEEYSIVNATLRKILLEIINEFEIEKEDKVEEMPLPQQELYDRKVFRLKNKLRELRRLHNHTLKSLDMAERRFETLVNIKDDGESFDYTYDQKKKKNPVIPLILLSDWHIEEKVDPATVNGLNEFNPDIAKTRIERCWKNIIHIIKNIRHWCTVDTVFINLCGDFITGYIHEELVEDNYLSPTEATILAKELILGGLRHLEDHGNFKKIIVVCNYGNHGRTTKMRRQSTGYKNSYEWMMFKEIQVLLKDNNLFEVRVPKSLVSYYKMKLKTKHGNKDFVIRNFHGDNIRYGGGIGGISIPLNKKIQIMDKTEPADFNMLGHWHTFLEPTPKTLINGSIIGYNAYAYNLGLPFEPPCQALKVLDCEKGITTTKYQIFVE
tara:strand:- start:5729 stop:6988 length:1260 start_codon:yes stop_codon:yes gene_type:complete